MKPFLFTLRQEPEQRLNLSKLAPDRLVGRKLDEIEKIELGTTKESAKVGDIFKVRPGDPKSVHYAGGSDRFDLLGARLLPGFEIVVEGDVGAQLGREAKGGTITVTGDAGPFAGSGMTGGDFDIHGNVGDFLGGPLAGELAGMAGGRIFVRGSAGARAGDRLRRGTIVIEGDAGEDCGARIVAGTVIVIGATEGRVGYLNKRGTIVLAQARELGPCYVDCGPHVLTFARMLSRSLAEHSRKASRLLAQPLRRYGGDTAVLGKGEILTPL